MKFWDTSALVPLIVQEATTQEMLTLLSRDSDLTVSVLTRVEILSDHEVVEIASGLLFRQVLRAADALQLAAAIYVGQTQPFVTLDKTLARAARAEGLEVQP